MINFVCRIGVVSGTAIFGPPLDEYWEKKLQEESAAKGLIQTQVRTYHLEFPHTGIL